MIKIIEIDGHKWKEFYCDVCEKKLNTTSKGYPIGYSITKLEDEDLKAKHACSKKHAEKLL